MGQAGGFFVYDGTVKSLPCLVEDFVFTDKGDNLGINYDNGEQIYAGLNHLYEEISWFYPKSGSTLIDRVVTYNYTEILGLLDHSQELLGTMQHYMIILTQQNFYQLNFLLFQQYKESQTLKRCFNLLRT